MRRWLGWLVVGLAGQAPAHAAESFEGWTFYLGDLHAHSAYSKDAASAESGTCWGECGYQSDLLVTAKANGLDFVAITDHVNGDATFSRPQATEDEFTELLATVLDGNVEGTFVTIPAAEIWLRYRGRSGADLGHKTLLFFGSNDVLSALTEDQTWPAGEVAYSTIDSCGVIESWMDGLHAAYGSVLLLPHHPAAHTPMVNDFACFAEDYEVAVEVYSAHGSSLTKGGDYDPPLAGLDPLGTVEAALDPAQWGLRMGFFAGTDRHDTRPGEVCVPDQYQAAHPYGGGHTLVALGVEEAFTREALYEAIVDRRTLATTGPALPVLVEFSANGAGLGGLGDELALPDGADLEVTVRVPADDAGAVYTVELVGPAGATFSTGYDGEGVWTRSIPGAEVPAYLYVEVRVDGEAWWGPGACDDGGDSTDEYVWTSPSWIEVHPAASGLHPAMPRPLDPPRARDALSGR